MAGAYQLEKQRASRSYAQLGIRAGRGMIVQLAKSHQNRSDHETSLFGVPSDYLGWPILILFVEAITDARHQIAYVFRFIAPVYSGQPVEKARKNFSDIFRRFA